MALAVRFGGSLHQNLSTSHQIPKGLQASLSESGDKRWRNGPKFWWRRHQNPGVCSRAVIWVSEISQFHFPLTMAVTDRGRMTMAQVTLLMFQKEKDTANQKLLT